MQDVDWLLGFLRDQVYVKHHGAPSNDDDDENGRDENDPDGVKILY